MKKNKKRLINRVKNLDFKNKYFLVAIVFFIIISIGYFAFFNNEPAKAPSIPKPSSYISSINGDVLISSNSNASKPKNNQKLLVNDVILVGKNSKASINIQRKLNSKILSNSNLKLISIKKNQIEIDLINGSLKNSFNGNNLTINTKNSQIFTKSSNFNLDFNNISNLTMVYVNSGNLNISDFNNSLYLEKYDGAIINNSGLFKIELDMDQKIKIVQSFQKKINSNKDKRLEIINSHSFVLNSVKKQYGITDEDIAYYLAQVDSGALNDKELAKKSPIQIDDINTILKLNDQIKNTQKELNYANTKFNLTN